MPVFTIQKFVFEIDFDMGPIWDTKLIKLHVYIPEAWVLVTEENMKIIWSWILIDPNVFKITEQVVLSILILKAYLCCEAVNKIVATISHRKLLLY